MVNKTLRKDISDRHMPAANEIGGTHGALALGQNAHKDDAAVPRGLLFEHALTELQDNISKVQLVLNEGGSLPENLDILHQSTTGRIRTLIVRGAQEETKAKIAACNPLFFDLIPLSLEEIFVYELGGADYEIKSIIL